MQSFINLRKALATISLVNSCDLEKIATFILGQKQFYELIIGMKTTDEIYQAIADNIKAVIGEEWAYAELNIETLGTMVSFIGEYMNANKEKKQIDVDEFDFQLTFDILELHRISTEDGINKWNKATVHLTSEGNFNMEFIWDQQFYDEIYRLSKE